MIGKGIVMVFLAVGALWDIKRKALPERYLSTFGMVAMVYFVLKIINGKSLMDGVLGLIPGCITLILCVITGEQIGIGDGLILLCVGCFQNVNETLGMIFVAFLILTIVSIFLLLIRRVGRKATIPFVPFLFCGQFITMVGGFL